MALNNVLGL